MILASPGDSVILNTYSKDSLTPMEDALFHFCPKRIFGQMLTGKESNLRKRESKDYRNI